MFEIKNVSKRYWRPFCVQFKLFTETKGGIRVGLTLLICWAFILALMKSGSSACNVYLCMSSFFPDLYSLWSVKTKTSVNASVGSDFTFRTGEVKIKLYDSNDVLYIF